MEVTFVDYIKFNKSDLTATKCIGLEPPNRDISSLMVYTFDTDERFVTIRCLDAFLELIFI